MSPEAVSLVPLHELHDGRFQILRLVRSPFQPIWSDIRLKGIPNCNLEPTAQRAVAVTIEELNVEVLQKVDHTVDAVSVPDLVEQLV